MSPACASTENSWATSQSQQNFFYIYLLFYILARGMGCSSTGSGYNRGIKGACAHERNNIRDFAKDLCSLVQPAGTIFPFVFTTTRANWTAARSTRSAALMNFSNTVVLNPVFAY